MVSLLHSATDVVCLGMLFFYFIIRSRFWYISRFWFKPKKHWLIINIFIYRISINSLFVSIQGIGTLYFILECLNKTNHLTAKIENDLCFINDTLQMNKSNSDKDFLLDFDITNIEKLKVLILLLIIIKGYLKNTLKLRCHYLGSNFYRKSAFSLYSFLFFWKICTIAISKIFILIITLQVQLFQWL